MKINKLFIYLFIAVTLFSVALPAFALELEYPIIPFLGINMPANPSLADFVKYFFAFGMYIAGAIVLLSLAIAAFQYVLSGGNPSMISQAQDRIKGSLIGVILLFSSWLLMQTINPVLTENPEIQLAQLPGVYLMKPGLPEEDPKKRIPAQGGYSDLEQLKTEGYTEVEYKCDGGPVLLVTTYVEKDFGGDNEAITTSRNNCNGAPIPLGGALSLKTEFESPGVYFYTRSGCNGAIGHSPSKDQFYKSVRIVNDSVNKDYYGVILNENEKVSELDHCSDPILSDSDNPEQGCKNINANNPSANNNFVSAEIFKFKKTLDSGDNSMVLFYTESFGTAEGKKKDLGRYWIYASWAYPGYVWTRPANQMEFFYGNEAEEEYKKTCKNLQDCHAEQSIDFKGHFLVVFYSGSRNYCKIFKEDVPVLANVDYLDDWFLGIDPNSLLIKVIPTK